jgi:hypothetical protein
MDCEGNAVSSPKPWYLLRLGRFEVCRYWASRAAWAPNLGASHFKHIFRPKDQKGPCHFATQRLSFWKGTKKEEGKPDGKGEKKQATRGN